MVMCNDQRQWRSSKWENKQNMTITPHCSQMVTSHHTVSDVHNGTPPAARGKVLSQWEITQMTSHSYSARCITRATKCEASGLRPAVTLINKSKPMQSRKIASPNNTIQYPTTGPTMAANICLHAWILLHVSGWMILGQHVHLLVLPK